jgi:hypothetical protein
MRLADERREEERQLREAEEEARRERLAREKAAREAQLVEERRRRRAEVEEAEAREKARQDREREEERLEAEVTILMFTRLLLSITCTPLAHVAQRDDMSRGWCRNGGGGSFVCGENITRLFVRIAC